MRFNEPKAAGKTKRVDGEDLTASCFLIVGDPDDTSTWKLPVKFSTDAKTKSHLRNALARFNQLSGVSEADKKKAWDKLVAMCKEHDIDVSDDSKAAGLFSSKGRLHLEVKDVSDDGTFRGVLSPYGNIDDGGDVVDPGAFARTLKENGPTRPMLWQHLTEEPVGMLTLTDSPVGLLCEGKFLFDAALPTSRKAYLLLKNKIVKGLSIGFQSVADEVIDGVRHLKEIKLFEGSIVTFPMNEMALVTAVKGRENKGDFNESLTMRQTMDAWSQMDAAFSDALCGVLWSGAEKDEKITMAKTVIEQFNETFMNFLPDYLDALEANGFKAGGAHETKEGRTISADTRGKLQKCHKCMKEAHEILSSLLDDESGDGASAGSKAAPALATAAGDGSKPGSVDSHPAELGLIDEIRSMIPA